MTELTDVFGHALPEDWEPPADLPMPEVTLGGAAQHCLFVGEGACLTPALNSPSWCVVIGAGLPTPPGGAAYFAEIADAEGRRLYRGPLVHEDGNDAVEAVLAGVRRGLDFLGGISADEVEAAAREIAAVATLIPDPAVTRDVVRAAAEAAIRSLYPDA